MREVEGAWGGLLEKFTGTVSEQFVDTYLDFERCIAVVLVDI